MKKNLKIPKGGNQNLYIEEEQTTQWPKEKVQKDKQRSTKHTYKTKDRVTRTPLKTRGELRCSRRVSSSCSTRSTHSGNLVINPVCHQSEWLINKCFFVCCFFSDQSISQGSSIRPQMLEIISPLKWTIIDEDCLPLKICRVTSLWLPYF